MAQVTGRVFIKINGVTMPSKDGAKLTYTGPGAITRDMVVSDRAVEGYKEKVEAPMVEATFIHSPSLDMQALSNFKDGTLTFQTDTNITFIMQGATTLDAITLGGGEVSAKFGATNCQVA